jgi:hypothetical protein
MSSNKRNRPHRTPSPADDHGTAPRRRVIDAQDGSTHPQGMAPLTSAEPTWWTTTGEWLRGKGELVWESALVPSINFVGQTLERIGIGRGTRRINGRTMRRTGELRNWNDAGAGMIKRVSRILMVAAVSAAVLVVMSALAVRVVGAFSHIQPNLSLGGGAASTATPPGAITIRNQSGNATPVGIPDYTFGMWMSNNSPSGGEQVTVYGKVMHQGAPVPGLKVTYTIGGNTTTITTDVDGIAAWKIGGNGAGSVPIEIDGAVSVGGQTLNASTFYTPI